MKTISIKSYVDLLAVGAGHLVGLCYEDVEVGGVRLVPAPQLVQLPPQRGHLVVQAGHRAPGAEPASLVVIRGD